MKAFLMYRDHHFDLQQSLPPQAPALIQDLEVSTLFNAMARGDAFLFEVAKKAMLSSGDELDTILYRQHILQDCLQHPSVVRDLYAIAVESIEGEKKHYLGYLSKYPDSLLNRSIDVLQLFVGTLKKLRTLTDEHAAAFESEGFSALFAMLTKELDDDYFASVQHHLRTLKFRNGVLMSATLGKGNQGTNYTLRQPHDQSSSWIERIFAERPLTYTFSISERDESGARALSELKDRGINLVANALAQSVEHILSFFTMLRTELAFYIGCLNLHEHIVQIGEPLSFPQPMPANERRHAFQGLYDLSLALTMKQKIVGNTQNMDEKDLVIITGANQGGKSTFLRSIGLAQLMLQCGMFVPARSFCANVCEHLFTHYKRQEDATLKSGKLDEELSRMSDIVDHITPNSLLLFNESFAATNEREGSEIARQIIDALGEKRIKIFFVTHLYELARGLYDSSMDTATFLRAERQSDGSRTFQLCAGEPLPTSYGADLYRTRFLA